MKRIHQLLSYDQENIEFTMVGEGEPILVFHGGHSNCHETFGYIELINKGFSIITPSRAGYGKTTKEIGDSLSKACQYYVSVLDHLHIHKVHVLGISAGGPTAMQFAGHYPERVETLILQSAVTKEWLTKKDKAYHIASVLFHPSIEKMTWTLVSMLNNLLPRFIYNQMAASFSTLPLADIKQRTNRLDIKKVRKMNNRQRSGQGFKLDLSQMRTVPVEQIRAITCPTLIMHSMNDGSVPYEHVEYAHQNIPYSHVYMIDSWGHLIWLSETIDDVTNTLCEFINTHKTGSAI